MTTAIAERLATAEVYVLTVPEHLSDAARSNLAEQLRETMPDNAAWARAMAALPEGWGLTLSSRDGMHDAYAINPVMSTAWEVAANGTTPAEALTRLADSLESADSVTSADALIRRLGGR